ncbi:MAG TPA: hypothetical protein VHY48_01035 [Acidobacteriaceae bacterium]|jgi:hypothetical protein|nr:hypothetical protein [Acidobacteriaceae bacterium]
MKLLDSIADTFILTFGITPPHPERRRVATLFINAILFLTIVAVLAFFITVIHRLLAR